MHHRDFVSLRHKALPVALHSGKSHIRVLLSTCCMFADCLHGCLSLCMINTHNVFLFFPFPFLQKLLNLLPLVLSQVQVSIHIHLQSMSGYFFCQPRFLHCHRNITSCFWAPVMGVALVSVMCSVSRMCSHVGSCVCCLTSWWCTALLHVVDSVLHLKPLQADQVHSAFTNRAARVYMVL